MGNKFLNKFTNFFAYKQPSNYDFTLPSVGSLADSTNDNTYTEDVLDPVSKKINSSIDENLNYIKARYNSLINSDIDIREFYIIAMDKRFKAFLIYIDGMTNADSINHFILKPLMLRNKTNTCQKKTPKITQDSSDKKEFSLEDHISNCLLPQNKVTLVEDFSQVISDINMGNCIVFVDTISVAYSVDVKGFKQRSISTPQNEIIVRGSQEAFVETLRTNTSILRRLINNENLIIENSTVGKVSNTKVAICYMNNIANADLVAEVQYRINNIEVDALLSSGQLEQLIQDNSSNMFPQIVASERPDKAVASLLDGKVIVIVNGSPYVLIMPGILNDFLASPEDVNLKFQFSNLAKIIRLFASALALLLPGLYVAITNYHQELLPTELIFAIAASRESVPFPIIFELLLMELSFELLREAGLRVPSPIGPTMGIVGALILGDAAVKANIVSPILIIIVALTALCSFAIPDLSLNFTFRILRFVYIFLGYIGGFLGIGLGLFILLLSLSNLTSFGVPYVMPFLTNVNSRSTSAYFNLPIWAKEKKPKFLSTKKTESQPHISMRWRYPRNHID